MFAEVTAFLKSPFDPANDLTKWLAIIGLLVVILYLWRAAARDFSLMERD